MSDLDDRHMSRAIELAERARGAVEPNPLVGAVVARGESIVAEGWHERYGGPHAEVVALDAAGPGAKGATLYVTLEPCCHQGKTPPCTEHVLASGVKRVVVAMVDPYPEVAGQGIERLRASGIDVAVGCGESKARDLNAPYLKLLSLGRPYVHAKWAMSLDGKIATITGASQWITGEEARRHAHQFRGQVDAIIVGSGTVRSDDPLLTARPAGPRRATRIVLDSQASIAPDSQLVRTAREYPTIVATTSLAPRESLDLLSSQGCECLVLANAARGVDILALLNELGRRRFTNVLVEGGASVLGSFLDASEIDAAHVYIAPKLIGGAAAPGPIAGEGLSKLQDSLRLTFEEPVMLGGDVFLLGRRPLGRLHA